MENVDLSLLQSLVQKASRDAEAALAGTERLYSALLPRFEALEHRIGALENRIGGFEHRVSGLELGLDQIARSNHRIETAIADIAGKLR